MLGRAGMQTVFGKELKLTNSRTAENLLLRHGPMKVDNPRKQWAHLHIRRSLVRSSSFDASPKAVLCSHLHHQALSKLMNDEFTTHQTRSTWTAIAKVRPFRRTLLRPRSSRPKEFMGPLPSVDKPPLPFHYKLLEPGHWVFTLPCLHSPYIEPGMQFVGDVLLCLLVTLRCQVAISLVGAVDPLSFVRIYLQEENRGVLSELNRVGRAACHLEPVAGWGSQRPGRADPEKTELGKRPQAAQQF
ncbi:hypothetical protein MJG53_018495 [Ovis ammon polii x Ovis aries]|uniref:Uncharacterized protein n=1 Tax=Ovis ammon polii x Ovis aries TaxID=2918886 RepID=A0ACB9U4C2_9CETA|nr:hypothetical protein MJG53_018495 [Ovis ammon polii x Ovis aries]